MNEQGHETKKKTLADNLQTYYSQFILWGLVMIKSKIYLESLFKAKRIMFKFYIPFNHAKNITNYFY